MLDSTVGSTIPIVASVAKILATMEQSPQNIRYDDLFKVCEHYFGSPRRTGGSHAVFATPWASDPRVNIQNDHGTAKAYRVRQICGAIEKLEASYDDDATDGA